MQTAGIFISALSKFSAGVQICQHELDGRHFPFWMNINGNAATVIAHGHASIDMHGHFDLVAKTGEMFVDRVVEDLENQVMQTTLIGVADKHARPFADRFQALQLIDLGGVVFLGCADTGRAIARQFLDRNFVFGLQHKWGPNDPRKQ